MNNEVALPTLEKKVSEKRENESEIPEFKVSGVFSSHMVLQRWKRINVWGFSKRNGAAVTGEFDGEISETKVENNKFTLSFSPREAADTPLCMKIRCEEFTVVFDDILIGDVWLIGGQSNAELNLAPCLYSTPDIVFDENGKYRLFMQTQYYPFTHQEKCDFPQDDVINPEWCWKRPGKENSLPFSAIGWFFADGISKTLDIPVGVINVSAGGSCIRELVPEELAAEMGYDYGANVRQGGYYNTLIHPFEGLSFTGMIFFQGESEGLSYELSERYHKELARLVEDERVRFGFDFPFYNVQLSEYKQEGADIFKYLDIVRIRQYDALNEIKNSALTVSMDLGSPEEYPDFAHSPLKKALTERITALVLAKNYAIGSEEYANSPMPEYAERRGDNVIIKFRYTGGGLLSKSGSDTVAGFTFGDYGSLTKADARIASPDTVTIKIPKDAEYVNYAFSCRISDDNAQLIKAGGLPCPAFRIKIKQI